MQRSRCFTLAAEPERRELECTQRYSGKAHFEPQHEEIHVAVFPNAQHARANTSPTPEGLAANTGPGSEGEAKRQICPPVTTRQSRQSKCPACKGKHVAHTRGPGCKHGPGERGRLVQICPPVTTRQSRQPKCPACKGKHCPHQRAWLQTRARGAREASRYVHQ